MIRKLSFWWRYLTAQVPWDTGITPPEITSLVEQEKLPPGHAVDLGCGTGTNAIYLALHGWHVVGIDYISQPIHLARRKAHRAGVEDRTRFLVADLTQLREIELGGTFDLAIDIGCAHSLPPAKLPGYARSLAGIVRPGGILMLYMFRRAARRPIGLEPAEVEALFYPGFQLVWSHCGLDQQAGAESAWYRFARVAQG